MNIYLYALTTYGITAVISFFVIALIIFINNVMNKLDQSGKEEA